MPLRSAACDFHVERFDGGAIPIAQVDLEREPLPYPDGAFDLVTCSEVVEHLENYRALLREAHRVTKPGGLLVLTTPNVLNAQSRMRYLAAGFPVLFGPLPVGHDERHSTARHITPIPYFYLAHALLETGFGRVELDIDKVQRTSVVWLALAAPVIAAGWLRFAAREGRRLRTVTPGERAARGDASLLAPAGRENDRGFGGQGRRIVARRRPRAVASPRVSSENA